MAKTSFQLIPAGLESGFFKALKSGDRFTYARISRSKTIVSRKLKNKLTAKSLLPIIKNYWNGFTSGEKVAWTAAAAQCNKKGYRLFVQDQSYREKYGLAGVATPSTLHQYKVGNLHIAAPAVELKIEQLHPQFYWVDSPVSGKKGMREPVKVTENFSLPLKIGLNYKANLVQQDISAFAIFYARVWSLYQGQNVLTDLEIPLSFNTDWISVEDTISSVIGLAIRYDLFIHLYNLRGDLFIDNIIAEHNAQNWARDPYCVNIDVDFTRAFYQIPKHWAAVTLNEGAGYDSVYPE